MQIQSISVGVVGNPPAVAQQADSAARQNQQAPVASGLAPVQVGGMLKNAVAAPGSAQEQAATKQDVDQAAQKINEALQTVSQKLEFSVDKDTEAVVVKVMDKETGEVIRQIPSEELLKIAKALDKLQGLLVKDQA